MNEVENESKFCVLYFFFELLYVLGPQKCISFICAKKRKRKTNRQTDKQRKRQTKQKEKDKLDLGISPILIYPQYCTIFICAEKRKQEQKEKEKEKERKRKRKKKNGNGKGKEKEKGIKSDSYSLCHEPLSIFAAELLPDEQ